MKLLDFLLCGCLPLVLFTGIVLSAKDDGNIRCTKPEKPENSAYNYTRGTTLFPGTVIEYHCDKFYELKGSKYRHCLLDGTWDIEMPQCELVNKSCPYPGHGPHSLIRHNYFFYPSGSQINYACDLGFVPIGSVERTCLPNGTWSHSNPICATKLSMHKKIANVSQFIDVRKDREAKGTAILDDNSFKCSVAGGTRVETSFWKIDLLASMHVDVVVLVFQDTYLEILANLYYGLTPDEEIYIQQDKDYNIISKFEANEQFSTLEYTFVKPMKFRYLKIEVGPLTVDTLKFCEALVLSKTEHSFGMCYPNKNAFPSGTPTSILNGTCYTAFEKFSGSFPVAMDHCAKINTGSLATDINADIQTLIKSNLHAVHKDSVDKNYWIGGQQKLNAEQSKGKPKWFWINDKPIQEFFWGKYQPTEKTFDPECLSIGGRSDWYWEDKLCDEHYHCICKHEIQRCGVPEVKELTLLKSSLNEVDIGDKAEYQCPDDFTLVGDQFRVCQENGKWSGSAPTCKNSEYPGTNEPGTTDKHKSSKNKLPIAAIVGIVVGAIFLVVLIIGIIFFVQHKKKTGNSEIMKYSKKSESAEALDADDKKGAGRQNYASTDDSNK